MIEAPDIPIDDVEESKFLPLFQSGQMEDGIDGPPPLIESDDPFQEEDHEVFQSLVGMMQNVQTTSPRTLNWLQFIKRCADSANCLVVDLCRKYPGYFPVRWTGSVEIDLDL